MCVTVPGCCCCMPLLYNHLMDLCRYVRKNTLLAAKGGCICTPLIPPESATGHTHHMDVITLKNKWCRPQLTNERVRLSNTSLFWPTSTYITVCAWCYMYCIHVCMCKGVCMCEWACKCVCVCVCMCVHMHVCVSLPVKKGDRKHAWLFHLDSFEITFGGASPRKQWIISGYRRTWKIEPLHSKSSSAGETLHLDVCTTHELTICAYLYFEWLHLYSYIMGSNQCTLSNSPKVQLGNVDMIQGIQTLDKSYLFFGPWLMHSTLWKLPY